MIKSNYVKVSFENHLCKHKHISQLNNITDKISGINFAFTHALEKTQIPVVDFSELSLVFSLHCPYLDDSSMYVPC